MHAFNRIEAIGLVAHSDGVLLRKDSDFGQLGNTILSAVRGRACAPSTPLDLVGHLYFSYEQASNFFQADPALLLYLVSGGRAARRGRRIRAGAAQR